MFLQSCPAGLACLAIVLASCLNLGSSENDISGLNSLVADISNPDPLLAIVAQQIRHPIQPSPQTHEADGQIHDLEVDVVADPPQAAADPPEADAQISDTESDAESLSADAREDRCLQVSQGYRADLEKLIGSNISYWVLLGLSGLYLLVWLPFAIYLHRHRDDALVTVRSPLFLQISTFAGLFVMVGMSVGRNVFGISNFASIMSVYEWTQNVSLPLFLIPTFFRIIRLRSLFATHMAKMHGAASWPVEQVSSSRDRQYQIESQMLHDRRQNGELRYAKHLVWMLMFLFAYASIWQWTIKRCTLLRTSDTLITLGLGLTLVVGLVMVCFSIRHVREAFAIKAELYMLVTLSVLFQLAQLLIVYELQGESVHAFSSAFPLEGTYHYMLATWIFTSFLVSVGMLYLSVRQPPKMVSSAYDEIFDSFSDFFDNAICRRYFEDYLALEWKSHLLLFWQDAEAYRIRFAEQKNADQKMSVVARNIYNKYVRDGSMVDVQLHHSLQMETGYCVTSGVTAHLFDAAQDAVYVKMSQIYPRFLYHFVGRKCASHLRGELEEVDMALMESKESWTVEHAEKLSAETATEVGKVMI